jgi:prepilin-type N-terminal cleavage/methylation domain-containing protein
MKGRKGFTLVELLLVVAILAVLAFLAVPAIASTIRNARIRTCTSNEILIEQTIYRWYADLIAAGAVITVPEDDTELSAYEAACDIAGPEGWTAPTLRSYFQPASQWPQCPFEEAAATTTYIVSSTVDELSSTLEGVFVQCNSAKHEKLRTAP